MATVQDPPQNASSDDGVTPGGFAPKLNWGVIGTAAPVFPGFEVDICDRVPDDEKPDAVWHRERAKAMIRAHPEIKELFGKHAGTAFWCLLCAGAQVAIAASCAVLPWWAVIALAWAVGAVINTQLFQLAHECDHNMVFKKTFNNRYLFMFTSLPMLLSGHHTWWVEHIVHHNDMGATKDFITRRRSFFLLTRFTPPLFVPYAMIMVLMQMARSIFGLLVYVFTDLIRGRITPSDFTLTILADKHLVSGYHKEHIEKYAVVYPLTFFTMVAGLCGFGFWAAGGSWYGVAMPMLYLLLAGTFFTGWLHPYCLGWVLGISHFHGTRKYQPTASNYGKLINLITFNAGLHVEHHDIMGIPWCRLPKLREIAPEFYNDLDTIDSYTGLGLHFVFGSRADYEANFNSEAHRNLQRFTSGSRAEEKTVEEAAVE